MNAADLLVSNSNFRTTADLPLSSLVDSTTTAGYTYICEALPGAATSDAKWRIQRIDSAGSTMWAGGTTGFDKIADNRASLTYSY